MNAARRTKLRHIASHLEELRVQLEEIRDEEQEAFDNMPQSFQDSDKGEAAQEVLGHLDDAVSYLENVHMDVETAAGV